MGIYDFFSGNRENSMPGKGLFSSLHIILIIIFFALVIINIICAKKNKKYAKNILTFCLIFMPISRLIRMIMEIYYGLKTPLEVLPFHLCHIMAFVIPICYFTKFKKSLPCVMFYGILGGIMTFLFGNYYEYNTLNFYDIESIILHLMLVIVPTTSYILNDYRFTIKNIHYIPIFLLLLAGYASLGNYIFDTNYMYLRENGLPFNLVPGHFMFTYLIIAIVIFLGMYSPFIYKYFKLKFMNKKNKL